MKFLPPAFGALAEYPQFIVWEPVASTTRPGKTDKFPIHPETRHRYDAHDPSIWMSSDQAIATAQRLGLQVGFTLTANDPFWFLDADDCAINGTWDSISTEMVNRLPGAGWEVSQSGRGFHLIGCYRTIKPHRKKRDDLGLELYHEKRFIALTGHCAQGNVWLDFTPHIDQLITDYFSPDANGIDHGFDDGPREDWRGPTDDDELLRRALRSLSLVRRFGERK